MGGCGSKDKDNVNSIGAGELQRKKKKLETEMDQPGPSTYPNTAREESPAPSPLKEVPQAKQQVDELADLCNPAEVTPAKKEEPTRNGPRELTPFESISSAEKQV
jgi:hypothetical protein